MLSYPISFSLLALYHMKVLWSSKNLSSIKNGSRMHQEGCPAASEHSPLLKGNRRWNRDLRYINPI